MTYRSRHVRSGLTAIAAVLALSSTPLVAQEVTSPPDPVTETTSEPAASGPSAPEATAPAADATEPAAEEPAAAKEAAPATSPTRRTAARSRTVATDRAPSEPVRSEAPAAAPLSTGATAEAIPAPPPAAAPVTDPFAPAEPVAVEEPVADEALPIAGAAGLGLLALGAIGLAVQGRRRRREERAHQQANHRYLKEHPEPVPSHDEPAFIRSHQPSMVTAAPAAVLANVPRTKLPKDFDLSRFGPHVQAAYLGPTEDNPSLSLRHRLRRAAAMDQRVRLEAGSTRRPTEATPARRKPALEPMWASNGDSFMLRRAPTGSKEQRPVTQH